MKKKLFLSVLILFTICISGCKYYSYGMEEFLYRSGTVEKRTASVLELEDSDVPVVPTEGSYNILVITDVHFGAEKSEEYRKKLSAAFINYVKNIPAAEKPLFCICLGDISEYGLKSQFESFNQFVNKLSDLGIKTYSILGNHDLYNSGWHAYKDTIFPFTSFYYFKTDVFSFYFIDSASGSLGKNQMNILENILIKDLNPKIVSSHIPIYANDFFYFSMQNSMERNLLISMMAENNVKAFFDGHTHHSNSFNMGNFTEYNIPGFLEKNEFGIITLNQDDVSVSVKIVKLDF